MASMYITTNLKHVPLNQSPQLPAIRQKHTPFNQRVMCGILIPAVALDPGKMVWELIKKPKPLLPAVSILTGLNMSVNGF